MSAALAVCALYFAVFIAIGFAADRRGSGSAESFYLGDRNFGAVPTALSVGASDSSGWVFTGAVGFAYVYGASMMWICVGYTVGIFCNYVFVAPALRRFTRRTGAASLPHYFALRFPECGARLRLAASALIAVFFTVYAAGQLTSAGKVFEAAGFSYGAAVWAAAFAATFYTLRRATTARFHRPPSSASRGCSSRPRAALCSASPAASCFPRSQTPSSPFRRSSCRNSIR